MPERPPRGLHHKQNVNNKAREAKAADPGSPRAHLTHSMQRLLAAAGTLNYGGGNLWSFLGTACTSTRFHADEEEKSNF